MLRRILKYIASFIVLSVSSLPAAEDWTLLKIGMSVDEATEALGPPLIRTIANGFEVWVYDNHAEAVFYGGPLVGWTTPTKGAVAGRAVDVWQRKSGQTHFPLFILPRTPPPNKRAERRPDGGVYSLPFYRVGN